MSTIGTYTLPVEPDAQSYTIRPVAVAGHRRALDGTMNSFYVAAKRGWHVTVSGLTAAQRDSMLGQLGTLGHLAWEPPEGGSYTVYVVGQPQATPLQGAEANWAVTFDVEQV